MRKTFLSLTAALLALLITFVSCGGKSDKTVHVSGIVLSKEALAINVGGKETITAAVQPSNAANQTFTWASSNTAVATVNNGEVTAVSVGTADITATSQEGGKTATCPVRVVEPAPTNPDYLKWLAEEEERAQRIKDGLPVEERDPRLGFIPSPFELQSIDGQAAQIAFQHDAPMAARDKATLPAKYDLREQGALTPVRDQGNYGTCWAHAALASLESNIKKASGAEVDLSEWHLAYYAYNPLNDLPGYTKRTLPPDKHPTFDQGGWDSQAAAVMARGQLAGGPVNESSAPYGGSTPSPSAATTAAIKNVYMFETENRDTVKTAVQTYGAVWIGYGMWGSSNSQDCYNYATNAYRYTGSNDNHAVNIVGWDDNYPRANFPVGNQPSSNGAWIIRNSWGTGNHDRGYFYMSYDTNISNFAVFVGSLAQEDINAKAYQTDFRGRIGGTGYSSNTAWFSNVFAATGSENVTEVAFYSSTANASYEITIRTGVTGGPATGTVALGPQAGTLGLPGYHRIKLDRPVQVASGQKFAAIVKLTENGYNYPISTSFKLAGSTGAGYISWNGASWEDYSSSICLKAFTQPAAVVVPVTGVTLNKTTLALAVGASEALTATVAPSSATNKAVNWSTSNASVATVSNGTVTAIAAGTATITATTQDGNRTATCAVTVAPVAVTGVSLNKTATTIAVGGTEALVATVAPSNAGNKGVTWTTSNAAIATVNNGTVTGVAAGTATITATTQDGNKTAACIVTVNAASVPVTGVTLDKTSTSIAVGGHEQLVPMIQPSDATNQKVTWQTSNSGVATVSDGLVAGVAAGTATITVKTDDGNKIATCVVTVTPANVPVTGVSLNKVATTIMVGGHEQLTQTVLPSDATNQSVTWTSSNSAVAAVSNGGEVAGLSAGTATITVRTEDGGKTATCAVTVTPASVPVTGVTLDKTAASITVGSQEQLTPAIQPSNATNQNVDWTTSNAAIATVNSGGLVTAVAVGTATITVRTEDGGKTATCAVTVTGQPVVTAVAVGEYHTLAIKSDGSLWAWGSNNNGELGLGDSTDRNVPTRVGTDKDWAAVSAGYHCTLAIKSDGSLWAWGRNEQVQLGLGDSEDRNVPTRVGTGKDWAAVSVGADDHTLAIKSDGSLWAWGRNGNGQLGIGLDSNIWKNSPTQVGTDKDWKAVSAGPHSNYAVKTDGSLWVWGEFDGHKTVPTQVGTDKGWVAVSPGSYRTFAIKSDGSLWKWGGGVNSPTQVGTDKDWAAVLAGKSSLFHAFAIKSDGSLWKWENLFVDILPTQVGTDKDWAAVSLYDAHTLAIKSDGSLWAWGKNDNGQLGLGDTTDRNTPTRVLPK